MAVSSTPTPRNGPKMLRFDPQGGAGICRYIGPVILPREWVRTLLLMTTSGCTDPNPAYRPGVTMADASRPKDSATLADSEPLDGAAPPAEDLAPAADAAPPVDLPSVADLDPNPARPDVAPGASTVDRLVSVAPGGSTATYGGSGGTPFADDCGTGVLVGYVGWKQPSGTVPNNQYITGLQPVCAELLVRAGSTVVEVQKGVLQSGRGESSNYPWEAVCGSSTVLVGFTVLAFSNMVENVQFQCASLTVDAASPGAITVGPVTTLEWSGDRGAGVDMTTSCPSGQVARGHLVQVGSWIDRYQMVCGTPYLER
jgi:hypothetical protein